MSAKGFAGLDPAESPQIRVPILMKDGDGARLALGAPGRSADPMGAGVRAAEAGLHRESAQAPLQGLFTQIREYEMTLPAAKDWSQYSRDQFMKGQLIVESAADGLLGSSQ